MNLRHLPLILIFTGVILVFSNHFNKKQWSPQYHVGQCVSFINSKDEEIIVKIERINFIEESYFSTFQNVSFEISRSLLEDLGERVKCQESIRPEMEI